MIVIDVAGAGSASGQGTTAVAVNGKNMVTGLYVDGSGVHHGFLRAPSGRIVTFDAPGAGTDPGTGTSPTGIDDASNIVGSIDRNRHSRGFVRNVDGKFTRFAVAGCRSTVPLDINSKGEIAGTCVGAKQFGFVRDADGTAHLVDLPGAAAIIVQAINGKGISTGTYIDDQLVTHSFLRGTGGRIVVFDAPGAGSDRFEGTYANAIDSRGEVVGRFADAGHAYHGFLRSPDGSVTIIDVRDADPRYGTVAESINFDGEIAGYYIGADYRMHGFKRWRDGSFRKFDGPGGSPSLETYAAMIGPNGNVAGSFHDIAGGPDHGYLRNNPN